MEQHFLTFLENKTMLRGTAKILEISFWL